MHVLLDTCQINSISLEDTSDFVGVMSSWKFLQFTHVIFQQKKQGCCLFSIHVLHVALARTPRPVDHDVVPEQRSLHDKILSGVARLEHSHPNVAGINTNNGIQMGLPETTAPVSCQEKQCWGLFRERPRTAT